MKKIVIIAGVILLLGGGAAGAYMSGMLGGGDAEAATDAAADASPPAGTVFIEPDEFTVSIITDGRLSHVVWLQIALEAPEEFSGAVHMRMPRLLDSFREQLRRVFRYRLANGMRPVDAEEVKRWLQKVCDEELGPGVVRQVLFITDWTDTFGEDQAGGPVGG